MTNLQISHMVDIQNASRMSPTSYLGENLPTSCEIFWGRSWYIASNSAWMLAIETQNLCKTIWLGLEELYKLSVLQRFWVSMASSSWWYGKPSNIPHGWHSKCIKDVANFIFWVALTCFLWNILRSFLVHSIQFNMNACHINPKHLQEHLTGSGGTL